MRKLLSIFALVAICCGFVSCDGTDPEKEWTIFDTFGLTEDDLTFDLPDGVNGEYTFNFNSPLAWSLEYYDEDGNIPDWVDVDPTSGDSGSQSVTFCINSENETGADRKVYVDVTAGGYEFNAVATQKTKVTGSDIIEGPEGRKIASFSSEGDYGTMTHAFSYDEYNRVKEVVYTYESTYDDVYTYSYEYVGNSQIIETIENVYNGGEAYIYPTKIFTRNSDGNIVSCVVDADEDGYIRSFDFEYSGTYLTKITYNSSNGEEIIPPTVTTFSRSTDMVTMSNTYINDREFYSANGDFPDVSNTDISGVNLDINIMLYGSFTSYSAMTYDDTFGSVKYLAAAGLLGETFGDELIVCESGTNNDGGDTSVSCYIEYTECDANDYICQVGLIAYYGMLESSEDIMINYEE